MASNRMYRSKMHVLLLAMVSAQASISSAFLPTIADQIPIRSTKFPDHPRVRKISTAGYAHAAPNDSGNEYSEGLKEDGLALPPIGASSFWDRPQDENVANVNADENYDLARPSSKKNTKKNDIIISDHASLVSPKFQLQYTCKICGYRNSHAVTRMAYRKGVVIAMCKGCSTKHWIADHLGWSNHIGGFDFDNGERDIETYMENRDHEARETGTDLEKDNDLVRRVNQDVFDLENILYKGPAQENNAMAAKGTEKDEQDEDKEGWR